MLEILFNTYFVAGFATGATMVLSITAGATLAILALSNQRQTEERS